MAELPNDLQQPLPSGEPLPKPFASGPSPVSVATGAGEALADVGRTLGEVAVRRQHELNAAQIELGQAAMISARADALDNPDSGFRTQRGLAAHDALPDYMGRLKDHYADLVKQAPNSVVARALATHGAVQLADFQRQASIHAVQQEETYKENAFKEAVRVGASNAVSAWADPATVENRLRRLAPVIADEARRQGDPEDTAGRYHSLRVEVAGKVLDELLVHNQVGKAEDFLGDVKELLGGEAARYEKELEVKRNQVSALNDAVDLSEKHRVNKYGVVNEQAAEDELNDRVKKGEYITPERYERTLSIVRQRNAAGREAENVATNHAYQVVMSTWQKGGMDRGGDEAVARSPDAQAAMQTLLDPASESGAERLVAFQRQVRAATRADLAIQRQAGAEQRRAETEARREVADAKREQKEVDQRALDSFHAIDSQQQAAGLDVSEKTFLGVSQDGLDKIKAAQAKLKSQLDKGLGEKRDAFKNDVTLHALQQGYKAKKDQDRFRSYMLQQYDQWHQANPNKNPGQDDVDKLFLNALEKVPSGHWYAHDQERWRGDMGQPAQPQQPKPQTVPGKKTSPPSGAPPGTKHVTDGTQTAWLPPGAAMPKGWTELKE